MARLTPFFALLTLTQIGMVGCEKVEFQSPPSWPVDQCDARFVGDWRVEDVQSGDDQSGEVTYIRVADDCSSWLGVEVDGDDPAQIKVEDLQADMELVFAHSEDYQFVVSLDKDEEPAEGAKPNGYVLVSYESVGEGFELRLLDPEKTAHLIVDGTIAGWLEKRDRAADGSVDPVAKSFFVYVFGDPERTRQLLDEHVAQLLLPVWMRLHPVDSDVSSKISDWTANGSSKSE